MSMLDTMTPLIAAPWCDATGKTLPVKSLPGLRPEVLTTLEWARADSLSPALKDLLSTCCGLTDTELGHIDFTGCCFPEEPCAVFNPCLTIAIDDTGRRWIADLGDADLPGPVWCIFTEPEVAVYVSDDLAEFLSTLRAHACRGQTLTWLRDLTTTARAVWSHRRSLALRPHNVNQSDVEIRGWLSRLPADAYVYDLRTQSLARGWPYGVAGPSGRLYRCARLPVFAAAGSPSEGWWVGHPRTTSPIYPVAQVAEEITSPTPVRNRRRPRSTPAVRFKMPSIQREAGRKAPRSEVRLCA